MKSLVGYTNSDDEMEPPPSKTATVEMTITKKNKRPLVEISAAPEIPVEDLLENVSAVAVVARAGSDLTVAANLTFQEMYRPVQGPTDMFQKPMENVKNTYTGYVEPVQLPSDHFETQRRTFNNFGYALDPSISSSSYNPASETSGRAEGEKYVGDKMAAVEMKGATVLDSLPLDVQVRKAVKKRRMPAGDPSNVDSFQGPWAEFEARQFVDTRVVSAEELERLQQEAEEMLKQRAEAGKKKNPSDAAQLATSCEPGQENSHYHGRGEVVKYMTPPEKVEAGQETIPPKKQFYVYKGHSRGVNMVKFLPKTGHLFLSASLDTTVKLWDVYNRHYLLRTFSGHDKSVRDIQFNSTGTRFLSTSYDKYIKVWDTEYGKCIERITGERVPYFAKFHPTNDDIILSGGSDSNVVQYDVKTSNSTPALVYEEHKGPVNTLTFLDASGKRFVTTADDKALKVWSVGQGNCSTSSLEDSSFQSMPAVTLHPEGESIACQSMDNHIMVFNTAGEKITLSKKKVFSGHQTSGYACQLAFSPDGKFIMSGDSGGNFLAWNWKTTKQVRRIKAHQQVTIGCDWHPLERSKAVTCSWDGLVKLWGV